jgi:hypothetical protein
MMCKRTILRLTILQQPSNTRAACSVMNTSAVVPAATQTSACRTANTNTNTTPYPNTLPATGGPLLSFVCTLRKPLPDWISPNRPPILGIAAFGAGGMPGGGGGAPPDGMGGGGGAPPLGIGGGGGGPVGDATAGLSARGLLLSILESGRGGPMVPKRMEASCLALPAPAGRSSSSLESEASESTTLHSSSSGRARVRIDGTTGSAAARAFDS